MGFTGALFLVFLVLKLTGYITWSWWWVTAPLWIGFLIAVSVIAIGLPLLLWSDRKKERQPRITLGRRQ